MDEIIVELVAVMRARAEFYRALAALYFTEIDEQGLAHYARIDPQEIALGNLEIETGFKEMLAYAKLAHSDTRQTLAADFARCFLAAGAYEERRATPFESVFTSEDGLLMQGARDDVYRHFCETKIEVRPDLRIPDDHLSFECEYMATRAEEIAKHLDAGRMKEASAVLEEQCLFHKNHLANWIDDFCDCLDGCSHTLFYQGVSKITRGFVHEDENLLLDFREALLSMRNRAHCDRKAVILV